MEIITTQGDNFLEGFELAFEGHRRAKSVFYHLCEDMYYLFLFTIIYIPTTQHGAWRTAGAQEILAEWMNEQKRKERK